MTETEAKKLCQLGLAVLETETQALAALQNRINHSFVQACDAMLHCDGRIVVIGMGKSGHIGGKIAATLASTGTPAFFVHPGEASHGDLGMITRKDVVLALSNSGETEEILTILPLIRRLQVPLISMTGNLGSTLTKAATVNLDVSVEKEACPLGLAPTASTTAALAMGDALAVALLESRGFSADDFARSHPGGRLGRRLLLHVSDVMHCGDEIPCVHPDTALDSALLEMTRKGLGMTAVVDTRQKVQGIYTDGDLRRTLDADINIHEARVEEVMSHHPRCVQTDNLAVDALSLMQQHHISALLVVDDKQVLTGVLHMHDLLRAGVV
ncbi:KpsF/GutQ family sugar-phosphate isomerase [Candidatus Venteria ishoeyi]|uniref:KpsF/GutQ family sugar-phosphate isomerase n=1 Tax=Candidatus Venteria ishoeyi TaxID=1899563 RepID=UPI0025A676E4|nr:KpsF/GutQ family sugar-phosphate isomerase [Candidatus Venteria ishoeyi]MDM8546514.1 KpsF/GutQ family sugar-phosphate isomerase [Candidatus Venteria ishoeyi]